MGVSHFEGCAHSRVKYVIENVSFHKGTIHFKEKKKK